mmetsp:Transcript_98738/g.235288  ORF Transcript_98738/g.235288 Transcript_98738/m.235288 type:complete len:278 (+) Transcript_98738:1315-2148(+)
MKLRSCLRPSRLSSSSGPQRERVRSMASAKGHLKSLIRCASCSASAAAAAPASQVSSRRSSTCSGASLTAGSCTSSGAGNCGLGLGMAAGAASTTSSWGTGVADSTKTRRARSFCSRCSASLRSASSSSARCLCCWSSLRSSSTLGVCSERPGAARAARSRSSWLLRAFSKVAGGSIHALQVRCASQASMSRTASRALASCCTASGPKSRSESKVAWTHTRSRSKVASTACCSSLFCSMCFCLSSCSSTMCFSMCSKFCLVVCALILSVSASFARSR